MVGQNDASLQPNLPAFERSGARKRRSGPKTLDQQSNSGDLGVKRRATWGMSAKEQGSMYNSSDADRYLQILCSGSLGLIEVLLFFGAFILLGFLFAYSWKGWAARHSGLAAAIWFGVPLVILLGHPC
jgi:hypothetical protein